MLEDPQPSFDTQRVFPDGRCELIFNFAEPFHAESKTGWTRQPQSFLVGQITGPMTLRPGGPAKILGIRFHPYGATQMLNLPANEITDQQISLPELSHQLHCQLERLHDTSPESQPAVLDRALHSIVSHRKPHDRQIAYAVSQFQLSGGAASVSNIARQLGLSPRHFERRFKAAVGISPKLFCRIQRFQRVLRAMDDPNSNWISTSIDCGYYDQSHLIRDFQQFTGKAPTALLTHELHLTRHFTG
jgi:AraC-like DNA-binding protein